jgi:hypothetical protein
MEETLSRIAELKRRLDLDDVFDEQPDTTSCCSRTTTD